jgi:predicted GNAT superfamily acetyltransferase
MTPQADAARAAQAAAVEIHEVSTLDGLEAVFRLYDAIWRPDPTNPPITIDLLRALTKAGNYVAAAYDGPELVGACVGFFGTPAGRELHSHIAGVAKPASGRSVGFALKLHQRAWALERGVTTIAWTFDPLVSRNAYFNLAKLGGVPVEYLPNFYGTMRDGINGDDESDRLLIHWSLDAPQVAAACAGAARPGDAAGERARGAVVALSASPEGRPVPGPAEAETLLLQVPRDIEALRMVDPGLARHWRRALRATLGSVMARGWRVAGFDRDGWYIVTRQEARP